MATGWRGGKRKRADYKGDVFKLGGKKRRMPITLAHLDSPFDKFTMGARFERVLRSLKPGQSLRMNPIDWDGIVVPASPYDHQTADYLAEWFRSRMPFYCVVEKDTATGRHTFTRPQR
jgi:hypothetical protein